MVYCCLCLPVCVYGGEEMDRPRLRLPRPRVVVERLQLTINNAWPQKRKAKSRDVQGSLVLTRDTAISQINFFNMISINVISLGLKKGIQVGRI